MVLSYLMDKKKSQYTWRYRIYSLLYVFHGRVTLFFAIANNFLTQRRITMKFLTNFF